MRPAGAGRGPRAHHPFRGDLPLRRSVSSSGHRSRRVAEIIRQVAATFLTGEARDPRIGLVTVTRVDVTADLSRAVLHYTVHGDAETLKRTAEGLAHAAPAVRREVGSQLSLRIVPEIVFVHDAGATHASRIEELLAELRRKGEIGGAGGGEGEPGGSPS